jgi:hypothetical protein
MSKIFDFQKLTDYEKACKDGWCYNPADVGKTLVEEVDKQEEEAEITPEPKIYRPEVPGQINPEPVEPFKCKLCDFVGKNEMSLKTHKRKKHGEK